MSEKLWFMSDYMEGAQPEILKKLAETNFDKTSGYGTDPYCEAAREKICEACRCPGAEVHFLVGGTQTNATVIDALLRSYQGVISAKTGHINVHESGAIEFGGHKVIALPHTDGKLAAADIEACLKAYEADESRDHTVMPGMVYLSQPTEYGTIYSLEELEKIAEICRVYGIYLYVDGARLAYALACPENDVTLPDLARLCDAFYIGGTKCGALFGEALVFPEAGIVPHFLSIIKQHGAMLAKGRLLGIQFDVLFDDGGKLYLKGGMDALNAAAKIRSALINKGFGLRCENPTNQIFVIMEDSRIKRLAQNVMFEYWERIDETHSVIRLVTGWATSDDDVNALKDLL